MSPNEYLDALTLRAEALARKMRGYGEGGTLFQAAGDPAAILAILAPRLGEVERLMDTHDRSLERSALYAEMADLAEDCASHVAQMARAHRRALA